MPQTEEEHLENESMEDDRSTKDPNDPEVCFYVLLLPSLIYFAVTRNYVVIRLIYNCSWSLQFII